MICLCPSCAKKRGMADSQAVLKHVLFTVSPRLPAAPMPHLRDMPMPLSMQQQQKLQQTLKMTPQLQQAIRLLQLSRLELTEAVQQELEENPFLEEKVPDQVLEESLQPQDEERPAEPQTNVYEQEVSRNADWEDYIGDFASSPRDARECEYPEEETLSADQRLTEKPTLEGHLLWQLHLSELSEEQMVIGEYIIGNLDSVGRLQATLEEIAEMADTTPDKVEPVLRRIQLFDPVGVACRDLRESLLVQVRERGMDKDPVLVAIISDHLGDFESGHFKSLMHCFKLDEDDLREYLNVIRGLDPTPGAGLVDGTTHYVSPDATVRKVGNDFVIILNDDGLPQLTITPGMEHAVNPGTVSEKAYCAEKLRDARWLIRSLEQRNRTLYKVIESIVRHQRDFFEHGPSGLKPLILNEIAEDIGMHESTVSRITTNKYVATPHGIYVLKYFFNSAVSMNDGSQVGSESVKDLIRKMIAGEDPKDPLSDDAIARELNSALGINIARRTVGKYRTLLKIPSSSRRRKVL